MIGLIRGAIEPLLDSEPVSHRSTAVRHAWEHGRPGILGDDPDHPSSVLWVRDGNDGQLEVFGIGAAGPAIAWLEANARGSTVALLAPESWKPVVRQRAGVVTESTIISFVEYDRMMLPELSTFAFVLKMEHEAEFLAVAPDWALRSWGDFAALLRGGLALGLRGVGGMLATAWTYESTRDHDKIGVATLPRYRRLGLGRRVAAALVERIVRDRQKTPLWVTGADNAASLALAKSLGFAKPTEEKLLRWSPG